MPPPPLSSLPLRPPAWATALVARSSPEPPGLFAAFAAGAALAALDVLVRRDAPFAGAWRQRLALKAAAATLEGKAGDEASLRDAIALTRPGGDSGPAGRAYAAWRALAAGEAPRFADIAAGLGAPAADALAASAAFDAHARSADPAPLAAAAAAATVFAALPRAGSLAYVVADLVLAARLGWRTALPLLALEVGRVRPGGNIGLRPGEATWPTACCAAYARAAARACDLHAEFGAAALRLEAVAPKLRAKGARAAISALLDDDAVSSATPIVGLSDRGLRRLFDRLVELGAARELTGRSTFRLYGL